MLTTITKDTVRENCYLLTEIELVIKKIIKLRKIAFKQFNLCGRLYMQFNEAVSFQKQQIHTYYVYVSLCSFVAVHI